MTVILTVEDEELISQILGEILVDAGHTVIATLNADEAIAILETRTDIRIIITDINMPGSMDGLKLAAAVRRRWPPVRIIVATGATRPTVDQLPDVCQFLPKPYWSGPVLEAVAQAERNLAIG
jgi:CheY-like chemotaxis protein